MTEASAPEARLVLFYLVRGVGPGYLESIRRFVHAYQAFPPGIEHDLIPIYKGFQPDGGLEKARQLLKPHAAGEFHTGDETFDLGAYADAVIGTPCARACFLNTHSEPVSSHWLLKLSRALDEPGVGLAGASGSFETGYSDLNFPNVHIRSNGFIMTAALARATLSRFVIGTKKDAHLAEHGSDGLTRLVTRAGLSSVVVGANGRAYSPEWWSGSRTFRQGDQSNLLVSDNQTRLWDAMTWTERRVVHEATWGMYRTPGQPFGDPSA